MAGKMGTNANPASSLLAGNARNTDAGPLDAGSNILYILMVVNSHLNDLLFLFPLNSGEVPGNLAGTSKKRTSVEM